MSEHFEFTISVNDSSIATRLHKIFSELCAVNGATISLHHINMKETTIVEKSECFFNEQNMIALPNLPRLNCSQTEERIERMVESFMDRADYAFMNGKVSREDYDRWVQELDEWAKRWSK